MTWKEAAEAVGLVAIVGSLIFVALEVQQNTAAVRSSLLQAISEQSYSATVFPIENENLHAAILADGLGEELDVEQQSLLDHFYAALVRIQQNRFLQARLSILDEATLVELGGTGGPYTRASFRAYWSRIESNYSPDFQAYMEREILPATEQAR